MLKKTIKYTDFNGNEISEDFYFNLTEAELIEMESKHGSMQAKLERIINTQDISAIMEIFKEIIVASYGVKSDDGKRFIKDPETTKYLTQSNAYSELYMSLLSNTDEAVAFITGIMPAKIAKQIDKAQLDEIKKGNLAAIEMKSN